MLDQQPTIVEPNLEYQRLQIQQPVINEPNHEQSIE
jgi:hypothetical protein